MYCVYTIIMYVMEFCYDIKKQKLFFHVNYVQSSQTIRNAATWRNFGGLKVWLIATDKTNGDEYFGNPNGRSFLHS